MSCLVVCVFYGLGEISCTVGHIELQNCFRMQNVEMDINVTFI